MNAFNIWKRLILTGVRGDLAETLHIKLTNIIATQHLFMMLVFVIFLYLKSLSVQAHICLLTCLGYVLVYVFNRFNKHLTASYLLIRVSYISVFLYTYVFGVHTGAHIMFLLLMVLAFLIFHISQYWHLYACFIMSFVLFFLFHFGIIQSGLYVAPAGSRYVEMATVICSFLLIGNYCINYITQFNIVQHAYSKANNSFSKEAQDVKAIVSEAGMRHHGLSVTEIVEKMSDSIGLGKRIILQEQKSIEKLLLVKNKNNDRQLPAHNELFDELIRHNYLANSTNLPVTDQNKIRVLMEFYENNGDALNKFIGSCLFSVIDDLAVLKQRLYANFNTEEVLSAITSINNTFRLISTHQAGNMCMLLQTQVNTGADKTTLQETYHQIETTISEWIQLLKPDLRADLLLVIPLNTNKEQVTVVSEAEPVIIQQDHRDEMPDKTAAQLPVSGSLKVLLAEDDLTIARIIEFRLKKEGIDVKVCKDGKDAVDQLYTHTFNLIITDLMMPFYNGLEIISIARVKLKLDTPIIVLSAVEEENTVVEALNIGANDFITKPFSTNELSSRIKKYLHY